jgi:hypothetical protein
VAPGSYAEVVSPDSSYATVSLTCTFMGTYRDGEPKDVITISASQDGETLASAGITIRVFLRDDRGQPAVGVPASSIQLVTQGGCTCSNGNYADGPSGVDGSTTFTGRIDGSGCGAAFSVRVGGLQVATVPVGFNSPDQTLPLCQNDVHDNTLMAQLYGAKVGDAYYSVCLDLDENGQIDLTDLSLFAIMRTHSAPCGP